MIITQGLFTKGGITPAWATIYLNVFLFQFFFSKMGLKQRLGLLICVSGHTPVAVTVRVSSL